MSADQLEAVHDEAVALLNAGHAAAAIALTDGCVPAEGQEDNVKQLQASMYTDGGHALERRDIVERGAALWGALGPGARPHVAYNLANAELALWELAVMHSSLASAWEDDRAHLHRARDLYDRVARDQSAAEHIRLQALTNAGNAYDIVGRDLDALERYDQAIAIDPTFGMALGNRGIALAHFAPFMGKHRARVVMRAAESLDGAIANSASVTRVGGQRALQRFEELRNKLSTERPKHAASKTHGRVGDPHLDWCLRHGLLLHVSPECVQETTTTVDPLFFTSVTTMPGSSGTERMRELVDAFNAAKQEYVAARYAAWLASDTASPIRGHATSISKRISFLDSLECARWGIRTGLGTQAFAASTNVLDKIASFVHLYLGSNRKARAVSFADLWCTKKGNMDPAIGAALEKPEQNIGLLALCDLSGDLETATPLQRRVDLRHTATHRFLVAHTEITSASDPWFDRVAWRDLVGDTIAQLRIGRAALIYLARFVEIHEAGLKRGSSAGGARVRLSIPTIDTELVEHE